MKFKSSGDMPLDTVGDRLRYVIVRLIECGRVESQKDFFDRLGVSKSTGANWLRNHKTPISLARCRMIEGLWPEVSADAVMTGEGDLFPAKGATEIVLDSLLQRAQDEIVKNPEGVVEAFASLRQNLIGMLRAKGLL